MKSIVIVVHGLNHGGIERVCLDYIKLLLKVGHVVDLIVLNPNEMDMIDDIPAGVNIRTINFSNYLCPETYQRLNVKFVWGKFILPIIDVILSLNLNILRLFRSVNKKYDIAIAMSGHTNDMTYVGYNFVKSNKKMCWLHGGLYSYLLISPGNQFLYRKIKNLVVLTDLAQDESLFYNRHLKLNIQKIFNPSFIGSRKIDKNQVLDFKLKYGDFILMVARIAPPKDHLGLIKAMEYLYDKYKFSYNVIFVGDGINRSNLEQYLSSSPIKNNFYFVGNQENPQNYYKAAKMFVLSSVSEGLPTVLIEACYFGLPIVASNASVREILGNNEYGLIAPVCDYYKLGDNIYKILSNKDTYNHYSELAKKRFEVFSPDNITNEIEDFIDNLI